MPRYVDIDALSRTIKLAWDTSDSEDFEKSVFIALATAPTADVRENVHAHYLPSAQKWIPVTERLPEENKPVLVTHHGNLLQAFVSVDWIDPYTHEWNRTCNVTAWMPLPEPYKERSK